MADALVIACTIDDIDPPYERWLDMIRPEPCRQFGCSADADRECGWCRSLFCHAHALHQCIRGQRRIDEYGEAA